MPTHKALTKLEPLPRPAAAPSANGGEPAYKSSCEFDFQSTCICLRGHEDNALPTQLTNFLIKERRATYSFARGSMRTSRRSRLCASCRRIVCSKLHPLGVVSSCYKVPDETTPYTRGRRRRRGVGGRIRTLP